MELARRFHAYSIYKEIPFDEEATKAFVLNIIDQGVCFFTSNGFVGGIVVPLYFNPKVLVSTELAWFSPDGGGRSLREYFEVWSVGQGASMVQFSALAAEDMDSVYKNLTQNEYQLSELTFTKRLTHGRT